MSLNIKDIRKDFPILVHHPKLVYLDSAATSLKPKNVINDLMDYYQHYSANIYRGIYQLSEKATQEYENTRERVARFINADKKEVVFTRNTTEAVNLIAYSLGRQIIQEEDEIITTVMEHHSNFVPWQQLSLENRALFKVVDIDEEGSLLPIGQAITKRTKLLAITLVSNVLGTINPVKEIIKMAKKINPRIITVVDAAQAIPHMKIDVADLGCDFLAFSSHKMLGPTGVGVLWGRYELLKSIFPFNFGGEMISEVFIDKTVFKDPPHKFEAGTPVIGEVIALKQAVEYLEEIGMEKIRNHEEFLTEYSIDRLVETFGQSIKIIGPRDVKKRAGIIAFVFRDYHPHDIAQIFDESHICIRAGHHCAMPLHRRLGVDATARASFYLYNDTDDIDRLIEALKKTEKILQ